MANPEKYKTYLEKAAEHAGVSVQVYAVNQAILAMAMVVSGSGDTQMNPNSDDAQDLYKAIKDLCESMMYCSASMVM